SAPRWYSAVAWPVAAALLYQRNASVASRGRPPLPCSYICPSLSMAVGPPAPAAFSNSRTASTGCGGGNPAAGDGTSTGLFTGCVDKAEGAPVAGTGSGCRLAATAGVAFAAGWGAAGDGASAGGGLP